MTPRRSARRAMRTAVLIAAVFLFLFLSRSEIRKTVPWEVAVLLGGLIWLISFLALRRRLAEREGTTPGSKRD